MNPRRKVERALLDGVKEDSFGRLLVREGGGGKTKWPQVSPQSRVIQRLGEALRNLCRAAGENYRASNSAALKRAQQSFQCGNSAQLDQRGWTIGQNDTFIRHFTWPDAAFLILRPCASPRVAASLGYQCLATTHRDRKSVV